MSLKNDVAGEVQHNLAELRAIQQNVERALTQGHKNLSYQHITRPITVKRDQYATLPTGLDDDTKKDLQSFYKSLEKVEKILGDFDEGKVPEVKGQNIPQNYSKERTHAQRLNAIITTAVQNGDEILKRLK